MAVYMTVSRIRISHDSRLNMQNHMVHMYSLTAHARYSTGAACSQMGAILSGVCCDGKDLNQLSGISRLGDETYSTSLAIQSSTTSDAYATSSVPLWLHTRQACGSATDHQSYSAREQHSPAVLGNLQQQALTAT